jgi:hypothetical protein
MGAQRDAPRGQRETARSAILTSVFATLTRLFVPSWRFFDDETPGIVFKVRVASATEAGVWTQVLRPPPRHWSHLFWNPDGNRTLAAYSLLERLLQDVADDNTRSLRTSLALVTELARSEVARHGVAATGEVVEFAIVDGAPGSDEELVRSEPFPC